MINLNSTGPQNENSFKNNTQTKVPRKSISIFISCGQYINFQIFLLKSNIYIHIYK